MLITGCLAVSGSVYAADNAGEATCPNPKKVRNICMAVSERTLNGQTTGEWRYVYQTKIFEAACVDLSRDSEAKRNEKIQKMWVALENQLVCNSLQFDVVNGNIIKFALSQNFDSFIDDVSRWRVNLNRVDPDDGKTVLDYIRSKIENSPERQATLLYRHYYEKLRKAGGKHNSEL